jgi:hypothetical protein
MSGWRLQNKRALPIVGAPFLCKQENLARRPGERAAAKQVDVEMIHALAAVFSSVEYQAVAFGG